MRQNTSVHLVCFFAVGERSRCKNYCLMKKLKFFIPVLAIFMALTACQKDNINVEEQASDYPEVLALKKHPVPFHAEFISTIVAPPAPNPAICGTGFPVLHISQTLEGNATHMGEITGTISSCANISTNPPTLFNRSFTLEAANGDLLYIFEFVITGGTGRFEDATGSVVGSFVPLGGGQFDTVLDGEIQY